MTKRPADRVLAGILSADWAIQPSWLDTIIGIAQRQGNPEAFSEQALSKQREDWVSSSSYVRDGVGVLNIRGPIFRYANMMTMMSGATSLGAISVLFNDMVESPDIHTIILDIDSPGGMVTGTNEFAAQVRAACDRKPVKAYVGGSAQSAAYWIASAAQEIIIDQTATLGSIGVVVSGTKSEREGEKTFEIVSSQSPNKRVDPTTEEGAAQIRERIDVIADVFINTVAANRGVDAKTVMKKFGKGASYVGEDAISRGMADRIGSLEGVLAECKPKGKKLLKKTSAQSNNVTSTMEERQMTLAELKQSDPEGYAKIMAEASLSAKNEASKEASEELAKANAELSETNKKQSEQINSMRSSVMKMQEQMNATNASAIMDKKLAGSQLSDRIQSKVRSSVSYEAFIKDDVLDTTAYAEAVDKEITFYAEIMADVTKDPAVLGTGSFAKTADENTATEDPKVYADAASRMAATLGFTPKQ